MPAGEQLRHRRQQAIQQILEQQPVARQAELVALLQQRGIKATQSSVSRDLRQLGIAKLDQVYAEAQPELSSPDADRALLAEFLREVRAAGPNLTVVKTAVGAAQRVAVFLDRSAWPEIVGTLSGDDTIFVATPNAKDQRQLLARLKAYFQS
jgi:transcriptional regulator of arginine metabolism